MTRPVTYFSHSNLNCSKCDIFGVRGTEMERKTRSSDCHTTVTDTGFFHGGKEGSGCSSEEKPED